MQGTVAPLKKRTTATTTKLIALMIYIYIYMFVPSSICDCRQQARLPEFVMMMIVVAGLARAVVWGLVAHFF
jgi:hypothetical protein